MAENVPPSSTAGTAAADQPGRPYYESLRITLRQTLEKKRKLDEQLATLEESIYKNESNYLEETATSGNIIRGFDGWVKGVQVTGRGADDRRRGRVRDEDRMFSRSSVSWMREKAADGGDSNTPSHAATPTASYLDTGTATGALKAGNKKKRANEKEEEDESKASKRGKITYARD
ncbi:hypothetical protein LTR62_004246 [Meristemomyces frigidus]|uniref:Chromatin modification-related protein EAF6 n=1 Tax=Meristemomyces frigidus TaxID=1508187 RepID=A0AAN7THT1_9PEZI|nr:hypothetical protein LTR62_004246 [Meristemomyces frigidus]